MRGAQDRAQLREEQPRLGEAEADRRASPSAGLGATRVKPVEPFLVLVGAEVERADRHRLALHARPRPRGTPRTARPPTAGPSRLRNRNSRAEQADARRAVLQRLRRCRSGSSMLACSSTCDAVERRRARLSCSRLQLLRARARTRPASAGTRRAPTRSGLTMTTWLLPSTISISPSRISCARVVRRDDRRNVEAARDDRGVRRDAAQIGEERGEVVLLELDHVGRRQVVRDQDRLLLRRSARQRARPAHQRLQHALDRPARRRPCARAGTGPRSARTARPARPSAASAPTRRCSAARR